MRWLGLIAVLAGCAHTPPQPPPKPAPRPAPQRAPAPPPPAEPLFDRPQCTQLTLPPSPKDEARVSTADSVTLRRTGCFGTCPIYSVTVFADGRVTALGERYVAHVGPLDWTIDAAVAKRLLAELANAKVSTLDPQLSIHASDLPSAELTGRAAAREFSLRHRGAGSDFDERYGNRDAQTATRLERLVDALSEAEVRLLDCVR